jgi:hypothetical protein
MTTDTPATWEERFQTLVDQKARDVNTGVGEIPMCNNFCRYQIMYPSSEQSDKYVQGMHIQAASDVLHIDPTVTTTHEGPIAKTEPNPNKNLLTFNGGMGDGADVITYELFDIMIQAPSRAMYNNTRFPMEVSLVHKAVDKPIYLVVCTFMTPDDGTVPAYMQTPLHDTTVYKTLSTIANNFPSPGEAKAVPGIGGWSPRMFYPPPDKRAFFYWVDNWVDVKASGRVMYLVFPQQPLVVPESFFQTFVKTLVPKGLKGYETAHSARVPGAPPPLSIFFNQNQAPVSVQTQYKCEVITDLDKGQYQAKRAAEPKPKTTAAVAKPTTPQPPAGDGGLTTGEWVAIGFGIALLVAILIFAVLAWLRAKQAVKLESGGVTPPASIELQSPT